VATKTALTRGFVIFVTLRLTGYALFQEKGAY